MNAYERAAIIPEYQAQVLHAMSELMARRDWLSSASALAGRAAALQPDDPKYKHNLGLHELKRGNLPTGWELYQSRFGAVGWKDERTLPAYEGQSLANLRLVVWPEQGLGEQILFASLLPELIERAGKVYIESKPRLAKILARSFPQAVVIAQEKEDRPLVPPADAQRQSPLASMARFLRPDFASFRRHTGYLRPDPTSVATLRARYEKLAAGRRIVGLSWRSANASYGRDKSIHLTDWCELLQTPGVMFVSLQYGDHRAELADVRQALGLNIYEDREIDPSGDLDPVFAQIAALDLVVSTSNTAVHAAGALNVPCWVALPRGTGTFWYWFLNRDDSPWYPSLRLFRQAADAASATWGLDVGARLATELRQWVDKPVVPASAKRRGTPA
jgi:hypothetical protein